MSARLLPLLLVAFWLAVPGCDENFNDIYIGPRAGAAGAGGSGGLGGASGQPGAGQGGAGGSAGAAGAGSGGDAGAGQGGAAGCSGGECPCGEGERRCSGAAVEVCKQQAWGKEGEACSFGCAAGSCVLPDAIAAGRDATYARFSDGSVRAWGTNANGELGLGVLGGSKSKPAELTALAGVEQVVASSDHACARSKDGFVRCWGRNDKGQVGGGGAQVGEPTVVVGLEGVVEVAAGGRHSCARAGDGKVKCWGDGGHGQLGQGKREGSAVPVEVQGLSGVVQLALMEARSCARLATGVVCWGFKAAQEPGTEADDDLQPAAVAGTQEGNQVAAGAYFGCVLGLDVGCWGANEAKQLGSGETPFEDGARVISGLSGGKHLGLGRRHGCVALDNGLVKCWGANDEGQVGKGAGGPVAPPATVPGLFDAIAVASGEGHTCALQKGGSVMCWGRNALGQLGAGTSGASAGPTAVVW